MPPEMLVAVGFTSRVLEEKLCVPCWPLGQALPLLSIESYHAEYPPKR